MWLETKVSEYDSSESGKNQYIGQPFWHEEIEGQYDEDIGTPHKCVSVLDWDSSSDSDDELNQVAREISVERLFYKQANEKEQVINDLETQISKNETEQTCHTDAIDNKFCIEIQTDDVNN